MTPAVEKLIDDYEHLSLPERQAVLREFLRRSWFYPALPLSDEALTSVADELFQALDAEEAELENPSA